MKWKVLIKEIETNKTVKTIPCKTERDAMKMVNAAGLNLNHERFYILIEEER